MRKIRYCHMMYILLFLYTIAPVFMVSMRQSFLLGAVALQCVVFGVTWHRSGFVFSKPQNTLEASVYAVGIFALAGILLYCLGLDIGYVEGYDTELFLLLFVLIYLTIAYRPQMMLSYFDCILIGLICVMLIDLTYVLVFPEMGGCVGAYVRDKQSVVATAMLALVISDIKYAVARKRQSRMIYATAAAVSAFTLALNGERLSLLIMAGVLLMIPVMNETGKEVLRRNLLVFGGYIFLLCNMVLLTDYTTLIKIECSIYSLEFSVVLELLLCIFAWYVMNAWDKLPEKKEEEKKALQALQRSLRKILCAGIPVLIGILLCGSILEQLPGGSFFQSIKTEGIALYREILSYADCNVFYAAVRNYGALGIFLFLIIWSVFTEKMRKRYKPLLSGRVMLKSVSVLCLILMSIWAEKMTAYGIYMWLTAYALLPSLIFKGKGNA